MKKKLTKLAAAFPRQPGVYKMKNGEGTVLYVGKAKDLRSRIKTYFQKGYAHSLRTRKLLEKTSDLEYLVTDSELEAYVLETNLIKELRPKYNILMKDDKNFAYIKIQLDEDFPRIRIVRKIEKDGAKYIGPKTGTSKVYETLRILKKLFPFRHCQLDIKAESTPNKDASEGQPNGLPGIDFLGEAHPERVKVKNRVIDYPCLDYFIKRCQGPCIGAATKLEYRTIINQIIDFLEGKGEELIEKLKTQMMEAASLKKFELASRLRDKLNAVSEIMEKQKISDPERKDTDVINFHIEMGRAYANIFLIRGGKLIRHENFILDAFEIDKTGDVSSSEILEAFINSYYEKTADIPKEVLIPEALEGQEYAEAWLSKMKGEKVKILVPQKGEKNKLLELSRKNAETFAKQYRIKFLAKQAEKQAVFDLAETLELKDPETKEFRKLRRIECYDISHFGGEHTVGSMAVFENGLAKRDHYRHFKLRTVQGKPDDFSSMKEVLGRRLKYLDEEKDPSISLKPASKKDFEKIPVILKNENISDDNLEKKDFLVAKIGEKLAGFGRITKLSETVPLLGALWIDPSQRGKKLGYRIMKKLIERSKLKRVYIDARQDLEEYYSVFGFIPMHQPPEALVKRRASPSPGIFMVYDATKHKIDPSFNAKPQLIVVDGGKPQLTAALQALEQFDLAIPVCALAKRLEEIYLPGKQAPILLEEGEEALKLLQRLRDEAHRFAIEFQRNLKRKSYFPT